MFLSLRKKWFQMKTWKSSVGKIEVPVARILTRPQMSSWCNWPAARPLPATPLGNEPSLSVLPYKEPLPVLCPEAETEMDWECPRGSCDSSTQPTTMRVKLGIKPFIPHVLLLLFGLIGSRMNLLRGSPPQVIHAGKRWKAIMMKMYVYINEKWLYKTILSCGI